MYFSSFPIIQYDPPGNGNPVDMTNLMRRVSVRAKIKQNASMFDTYTVKSGETPESLAYKLYGDAKYHWVILLFNDITDRYLQWPLTERQFDAFLLEKYTTRAELDSVHHYEITQESGDGTVKIDIGTSNADYPSATPITNYEFEEANQNELRQIRLLDPRYLDQFVKEFKNLMKEAVI